MYLVLRLSRLMQCRDVDMQIILDIVETPTLSTMKLLLLLGFRVVVVVVIDSSKLGQWDIPTSLH